MKNTKTKDYYDKAAQAIAAAKKSEQGFYILIEKDDSCKVLAHNISAGAMASAIDNFIHDHPEVGFLLMAKKMAG